MIDGLFTSTNYLAAKKLLDATVLRHEALAANLANVETPHYRRVDIAPSFAQHLQQAIAAKSPQAIAALEPKLSVDANAAPVSLETELLHLQQNTLTHGLAAQLVSSRLLKLRLAITGRAT
ncbi:MAG: flagellar basal body rod protein FlgB [Verrucomicrobiae bacterium]|nr:flagellar basal body rod protein FlgB [Verrucomicrobiae bacterium]MDW8344087.1 flagellar basal body rod protein FlgB [Verrucomicrobiae bacterium]